MLLGVYWYYGFPDDLYQFDFFTFRPGLGGHADAPAELATTVLAPDPAALLAAVQAVATRYPDGYLFGQAHGACLRLELGDYGLTDYTFHVAGELEQVLRQQHATLAPEPLPPDTPLLRLATPQDPYPPYAWEDGLVQAVSAKPGPHRAEVALLRLDCHLPTARQASFLHDLDQLSAQFGLDVLYYFDRKLAAAVNLMVFFGNGRQGIGGSPLRYTDTGALRTAVAACLHTHSGQAGHLGSYPKEYPRRGPHVVRVVDDAFIL